MHRSAIVVVCSVCRTQNKHNATDRESFYHVANACGIHIWEGESVLPGGAADEAKRAFDPGRRSTSPRSFGAADVCSVGPRVAKLPQVAAKGFLFFRRRCRRADAKNTDERNQGCCARAASGRHATAAPPRSVINSGRRMCDIVLGSRTHKIDAWSGRTQCPLVPQQRRESGHPTTSADARDQPDYIGERRSRRSPRSKTAT